MLTQTDLIRINQAHHAGPDAVAAAHAACGNPSEEALVATALAGMHDADRNVRVAMLWTLGRHPVGAAADGILAGLGDAERRVREVAIKCAQPFLADARVRAALVAIARDEAEKRKLRELALDALCGQVGGRANGPLPAAAVTTLADLLRDDAYRRAVIERLVRTELTPDVRALLEDVVRDGVPAEAALAGRALTGEVVINLGSVDDDRQRATIAATHDPAYGRVYFWTARAPVEA